MYRILVVCLGNICRSPTAEAALRAAVEEAGLGDRVTVDSAGTGDWHIGYPPDERMARAAALHGLTLSGRARQVAAAELAEADLVLAMDRQNLADLQAMAAGRDDVLARLHLYRDFEPGGQGADVPDPYYGGADGFAEVVRIVRAAAAGVVDHVWSELDAAA
jgi:protein-tyrosine phosphatase